jgi:hypothetical protein
MILTGKISSIARECRAVVITRRPSPIVAIVYARMIRMTRISGAVCEVDQIPAIASVTIGVIEIPAFGMSISAFRVAQLSAATVDHRIGNPGTVVSQIFLSVDVLLAS